MGKFIIETEENLLKLTICENAEVNVESLKKLYRILTKEDKITVIKLERYIYMEKEARDFMNRIENRRTNSNITIIADSFSENLLANFYNKFYKPTYPIKVFRKEKDALHWLKLNSSENDFKFFLN